MSLLSSMIKPILSLFLISAAFGIAVGVAHSATLEPIAKQTEQRKNAALAELIPNAIFESTDESQLPSDFPNITAIEKATIDGSLVGYVATVRTKGYAGDIDTMVAVSSADAKIRGLRILKQSETPGLGANASKPYFYDQFVDKPLEKLTVSKLASKETEVQAITASTITTRAITDGVNEVIEWVKQSGGAE